MESGLQPRQLRAKFDRAAKEALKATADRLSNEFINEITTVKWGWKGDSPTFRKNGEVVTEPRNIVDQGDLRKSQNRQKDGRYGVKWTWEVDYSALVHDGASLKGGVRYPKRPWTETAEANVVPTGYFEDILRRELDG